MALVTPPSFNSPEPLSARFYYRPRASRTQAPTHEFGTTGYAFIRQAWDVVRRIDFDRTSLGGRLAYKEDRQSSWYDPRSLTRGTRFEVALTEGSQTRGTRWDNDFNRALWAWTFLQWDQYNGAHGLPSASDQFFGGATSAQRAGWVALLNNIENCEVTQSVSLDALRTAGTLVLYSLDLIASTTDVHVYIEPNTRTMPYGVDPPLPPTEARAGERRFATWARSNPPTSTTPPPAQLGAQTQGAVTYVDQQPQARPPTLSPSTVPPQAGGGRPPVQVGLTDTQKGLLSAAYALGGVLVISGVVIMLRGEDG